jgi:hypothetical protein
VEDRLSSSESEDEWDLGLLLFILWGGLLIIMDTILENLIDDRSLNQSTSTHISWRDLPNREEEGLGNFFTGILERSRSAAQRHAPATNDNDTPISYAATLLTEVARSPGPQDYPLWRVCCRVSQLLCWLYQKLKQSSS